MEKLQRKAIVDSGVLAAAANPRDTKNQWAITSLASVKGRAITCEAAITEAVHLVKNNPIAVERLQRLLSWMTIRHMGELTQQLLDAVRHYSPRMDYADACALAMQKETKRSYVLTIDHADFATYGAPFSSPEGQFY